MKKIFSTIVHTPTNMVSEHLHLVSGDNGVELIKTVNVDGESIPSLHAITQEEVEQLKEAARKQYNNLIEDITYASYKIPS